MCRLLIWACFLPPYMQYIFFLSVKWPLRLWRSCARLGQMCSRNKITTNVGKNAFLYENAIKIHILCGFKSFSNLKTESFLGVVHCLGPAYDCMQCNVYIYIHMCQYIYELWLYDCKVCPNWHRDKKWSLFLFYRRIYNSHLRWRP